MKIAEIFYSVQGEGSLVGAPSVFIRTSGCNLRCSWCDTPYTSWRPEGVEMTLDEIITQAATYKAPYAVITGGEPMIAPGVIPLTEQLRARGMHITVETAGTVWRELACDLMSISPKLSNSTPEGPFGARHERLRIQPDVLSRLIAAYEYQLKFVIARPEDLIEVQELVGILKADPRRIILMPEGIDAPTLREPRDLGRGAMQANQLPLQPSLACGLVGQSARNLSYAKEGNSMIDDDLRTHLREMEERLEARIEKSETNLLRAFHGWARSMEVRQRGASFAISGFDERLGFVEERISELERKRNN